MCTKTPPYVIIPIIWFLIFMINWFEIIYARVARFKIKLLLGNEIILQEKAKSFFEIAFSKIFLHIASEDTRS